MLGDRLKIGRGRALQEQALGVYFHESAVCVVWLDGYAGRQHLLASACVPCVDAISQGQMVDKPKLAEAIKDACDAINAPQMQAIACVADEAVMTTIIELPAALSDADIEAQILVDAERYIGRPLDEVYFDFQVLNREDAVMLIALTVAHKAFVDDCVEVLAMAGLEARAIDVAALCRQSMAAKLGESEVAALIEVDAWQIRCHIAKQSFFWSQTQPLDPMLISVMSDADAPSAVEPSPIVTDALDFSDFINQRAGLDTPVEKVVDDREHHYQISFDDAVLSVNDMVTDRPKLPDGRDSDQAAVHADAIDRLGRQIVMLLNLYQEQYTEQIGQVYLMGLDSLRWAGLDHKVAAHSGLACQFAHPKLLLQTPEVTKVAASLAPLLMMPTMLALRATDGVNLLPWRDEQRSRSAMRFRRMLQAAIAIPMVLALTIFAILNHQIRHQNAINAQITARINTVDDQLQQIQRLKTELKSTEDQLGAIDGLASDRSTIHRWQLLPSLVPDGVYLDGAKQTGDALLWTGKAVDAQAVSVFANALELSGVYSDVLVVSLQQAGRAMSFSISAIELPLQPEDMQVLMTKDAASADGVTVDAADQDVAIGSDEGLGQGSADAAQ